MTTRPLRAAFAGAALAALSAALSGLGGCATTDTAETLTAVPFSALPGWAGSDQSAAFAQFRVQCGRMGTMAATEPLGGSGLVASAAGTAGTERAACLAARDLVAVDAGGARRFFETWFSPYRGDALTLAGYDEPTVAGSLGETATDRTPVWGRPSDLVTVRGPDGHGAVSGRASNGVVAPYDTRREIDGGTLRGRAPVIAWVADTVDLYRLQKEGAGRIRLADGSVLRLAYAGQNGRRSLPIADRLVAAGLLAPEDTGSAAIRAALLRYRDRAGPLIEDDPSYVFFRVLAASDGDEGPPGTLGVTLAPLHSLVVDREAIPLGVPVYLAPAAGDGRGLPLPTLAFAEDEGGDVASAGRADLFLGAGDAASRWSDALPAAAEAFLLLPRPLPPAS